MTLAPNQISLRDSSGFLSNNDSLLKDIAHFFFPFLSHSQHPLTPDLAQDAGRRLAQISGLASPNIRDLPVLAPKSKTTPD
jgi:hypothetical protein